MENKSVLYMNQCVCLWSAESSRRCVLQRASICFSASRPPSCTLLQSERQPCTHSLSSLKRALWECKILREIGGFSVTQEQTPLLLDEWFHVCSSACGQNPAHSLLFAPQTWKGVEKGRSCYTLQTLNFQYKPFKAEQKQSLEKKQSNWKADVIFGFLHGAKSGST